LKRLAQILELAVDYGHLPRNPASKGGRRRLKESKPQRSWVEPEQLMALLDAAPAGHRPVLATLAGAGLRVGEACALTWRDVNLATGSLIVGKAKTDAGTGREVDLPLGLADELRAHKAGAARTGPDDPVFLSGPRNGRRARQTPDNVGRRLKTAIGRANPTLAAAGIEPISERVSPHSLRRTYASVRAASGDDPVYIAEQLGHEDPTFTIRVYAKAAKRRERLSDEYRRSFDQALEWAEMGRIEASGQTPARCIQAAASGKPAY
jgi:integrase